MTHVVFQSFFDGLSRPAIVEGVYLGMRALSHRLAPSALLHSSAEGVEPGYKAEGEVAAFKTITSIEQAEGVDVSELPGDRVSFYIHELSTFLHREIGRSEDAELVARVEEELGRL